MNINLKAIKPFLIKHGPTILTGLATVGVVATGYLTRRAVLKNLPEITEAVCFADDSDIPIAQTIKRIERQNWKYYIPPAVVGILTIGCGIGANQWHLSKEGLLAAAALTYKASGEELEAKLKEKFGAEAVDDAKKELAKERKEREDDDRPPWIAKNPEKMKIWEPYSKQWIYASQKDLLCVELMANKLLQQASTVPFDRLLSMYGVKGNKDTKHLGWSYEDESFDELACYYYAGAWIDLCPQLIENQDGTSFLQMEYGIHPNYIPEVIR